MPELTRFLRAWVLPPGYLVPLGILAASQVRKRPKLAQGIILSAVFSIYLLSLDWVHHGLFNLYCRIPPATPAQLATSKAQAIVVLSGGLRPGSPEYGGPQVSSTTLARTRYGCWLQRQLKLPMVLSGGYHLAEAMEQVALEFGCSSDQIVLENQSRTTFENAKFSKELLKDRGFTRIILVTEAFHIRRAVSIFERQQLEVIPAACEYPCDYFSPNPLMRLVPTTGSLLESANIVEDACGYVVYSFF